MKHFVILLFLLTLTGCSTGNPKPEKEYITITKTVKQEVPEFLTEEIELPKLKGTKNKDIVTLILDLKESLGIANENFSKIRKYVSPVSTSASDPTNLNSK